MSETGDRGTSDPIVAQIVGLPGSLRPRSATQMAVRCALLGAQDDGARTRLLDLGTYDLPFMGREQEPEGRNGVERFVADLRTADGMVLGSPEIHGSISGVLKNALDLVDRELFEGKMMGLIGVAGGRMGASETLSHLRTIARSLHAWVVPTQVSVADSAKAFDARGEPLDGELRERLEAVGRQVAHFAWLHKCGNHLQFLREWEGAVVNGGE